MLRGLELHCIPIVESEVVAGWHSYELRNRIIPSCRSQPTDFCQGCTRDVQGIVFVCSPKRGKLCCEILHQARTRPPVDAQGNPIEAPSLIKKRKQSSLGIDRVPKRLKKLLLLNAHHEQIIE